MVDNFIRISWLPWRSLAEFGENSVNFQLNIIWQQNGKCTKNLMSLKCLRLALSIVHSFLLFLSILDSGEHSAQVLYVPRCSATTDLPHPVYSSRITATKATCCRAADDLAQGYYLYSMSCLPLALAPLLCILSLGANSYTGCAVLFLSHHGTYYTRHVAK